MKIDVKKFSKIQDIYISPDPQEHRPAWIWFAYIWDPAWEKNFRPTVMRLKFLKELGKSIR